MYIITSIRVFGSVQASYGGSLRLRPRSMGGWLSRLCLAFRAGAFQGLGALGV